VSPRDTEIFSRDLPLSDLLDGIEAGTVALPNFQRDFDWNESDVVSLIATVLMDWPAGSLLIMDGEQQIFDLRPFEGAPDLSPTVTRVVLDGQQRLTSLLHAFRDCGPSVYALDIDAALRGERDAEALESAIKVIARDDWPGYLDRVGRELIPLSVLISAAHYYEWRDALVAPLPTTERDAVASRLADAYKRVLARAGSYRFPSVQLGAGLEAPAVARIFERINKTGMRLSTFDLLVARSFSTQWNLREAWTWARDETELVSQFLGDDGLPVVQVIALKSAGDVRQAALLRLQGKTIRRDWTGAVDAVEQACAFMQSLGVPDGTWLPYRSQLLPLAALALDEDLDDARPVLEPWFWAQSFGMGYEVGSSTVAAADYRSLSALIRSGRPPRFAVARPPLLTATRKQQSAVWRAFVAALRWHGARDPVTGEALARLSPAETAVVPAVRANTRSDTPWHLLVLNQALAAKTSSRRLRVAPWIESLPDSSEAVRRSQFVPRGFVNTPSRRSDPAALAAARLRMLERVMQRAYGSALSFVEPPSDEA
jgi:hypothetical protein